LELDLIINSLKVCPYPYILTGDFNEIIYGNNYYKLRKMATNSFEEAGSGFGFTFNSILFFIRIDHQFYSDQLDAVNLRVIKDVKSSDHYPLKGWYNFSKLGFHSIKQYSYFSVNFASN
jgi:endonuclease/exonuclease/phosphatase (EEP) superfamily protein YafD